MRAALADRGVRAALVLVAVAAAGLAGLGLAWRGAAATLGVWVQMPFVVSGAVGGVALAGCFLALLGVHLERRAAARERLVLESAIASAAETAETLLQLLEGRPRSAGAPRPAQGRPVQA